MTIIKILQYPDPRLKTKARLVKDILDKQIQKIIDDMFETHYNTENCAALAATQLDIPNPPHITVIDFSANKDQPLCLINAQIIERSGDKIQGEGCMSVAGIYEKIKRSEKIRVKAHNREGNLIEFAAEEFMAKCIQHELDHLNGLILLDRLSTLKRARIDKKFEKWERWNN